jgi:hypothetical protein
MLCSYHTGIFVSNFQTTLGPPGGQVTEGTLVPGPRKQKGIKGRIKVPLVCDDMRGKTEAGRELGPI